MSTALLGIGVIDAAGIARTGAAWATQSPEAAVLMTLAASVTLFLLIIAGGAARRI